MNEITKYVATCLKCSKKTYVTETGEDDPGYMFFDKPYCAWCGEDFVSSAHHSPFSIRCEKIEEGSNE